MLEHENQDWFAVMKLNHQQFWRFCRCSLYNSLLYFVI